MPSEPRKLPVINLPDLYLRFGNDTRCGQEYVRIWDMSLTPKDGLTKYEPSVPRCLTCSAFVLTNPTSCKTLQMSVGENDYCHLHPNANR